MAVLTVAGLGLRLWDLGSQSLWYDEWLTADSTQGGVRDLIHHISHVEGIGPTYFVVMWGWTRAFGDSEASLRFVSVLFGVATIPAAYAAVRALGQRQATGLAAALVVAVHPMLIWYSQEARPYSVLAFCGVVSVCAYVRARDSGALRDYLFWSSLAAVTVSIHYFAIFLFAVQGAALLVHARANWRPVLVGCTPLAVGLVALAPLAASQHANAGSAWISEFAYSARLADIGTSALVGPSSPEPWLWLPVGVIVVVAGALLVSTATSSAQRAAFLSGGLGVGGVLLAIVTTLVGPDFLVSRYVIASLVPIVVAVVIGLTPGAAPDAHPAFRWLGGVGIATFCTISVVVVATVSNDSDLQKPDWRAISDIVNAPADTAGSRAVVMNLHGHQGFPLRYYLDRPHELTSTGTADVQEIDVLVAKSTPRPCSFLIGRACAMVFLGAPLPEPLAQQFTFKERIELDQFTIERYRANRPVPLTKEALLGPESDQGLVMVLDIGDSGGSGP